MVNFFPWNLKLEIEKDRRYPSFPTKLSLRNLSFTQMKAFKILADYQIIQELAL